MTGNPVGRLLCGLALISASAVHAGAHAADVRPMLKAGFDFGGDPLATVQFTDGTVKTIKANEGFYLGGGLSILNEARNLDAEISIAYEFALINPRSGDARWTRVPLEALLFYRRPKFRLGGGLTYQIDPKIHGTGVTTPVDMKFDNAAGLVLQADYLLTERLAVGLRYTSLELKESGGGRTFNASGPGISASYRF